MIKQDVVYSRFPSKGYTNKEIAIWAEQYGLHDFYQPKNKFIPDKMICTRCGKSLSEIEADELMCDVEIENFPSHVFETTGEFTDDVKFYID